MKKIKILIGIWVITIMSVVSIPSAQAQTSRSSSILPVTDKLQILTPKSNTIWQIQGGTHKISWTPNPESSTVEAYLETKLGKIFKKYAKIIPCAKGSIIWCGEVDLLASDAGKKNIPDVGSYYVSIIDKATNQESRTSSPIKLVPYGEAINLNLKAFDIPGKFLNVPNNTGLNSGEYTVKTPDRNVGIIWTSNADSCDLQVMPHLGENEEIGDFSKQYIQMKLKSSGQQTVSLPEGRSNYAVVVSCQKDSNYQNKTFFAVVTGDSQPSVGVPEITLVQAKAASNYEMYENSQVTVSGKNFSTSTQFYLDIKGNKVFLRVAQYWPDSIILDVPSIGLTPEGKYKLYAVNGNQVSKGVIVNYIKINLPPTDTSKKMMEVVYPNGGEQLSQGSLVEIKVKQNVESLLPLNYNLQLYKNTGASGHPYTYVQDIVLAWDKGSNYTWRIPSSLATGQYVIYLTVNNVYSTNSNDFSDRPFKIIKGSPDVNICPVDRDLALGSAGDDVSRLQEILINKGFLSLENGETGYFGNTTKAAVAKYQQSVGISPADGYFGVNTRISLFPECGSTPKASIQILKPMGGETFKNTEIIPINYSGVDLSDTLDIYLYNPEIGSVAQRQIKSVEPFGTGKDATELDLRIHKIVTAIQPGDYRITICDNKTQNMGKSLCAHSQYFKLTSGTLSENYSVPVKITNMIARNGSNSTEGVYEYKFTVSSPDKDIYIPAKTDRFDISTGVSYEISKEGRVERQNGDLNSNATIQSTAPQVRIGNFFSSKNYYVVKQGKTENFSVKIMVKNVSESGKYRASLFAVTTYSDLSVNNPLGKEVWFDKQNSNINTDYISISSGININIPVTQTPVASPTSTPVQVSPTPTPVQVSPTPTPVAPAPTPVPTTPTPTTTKTCYIKNIFGGSWKVVSCTSDTYLKYPSDWKKEEITVSYSKTADLSSINTLIKSTGNLEVKSTHPDVITLQQYLNSNGYIVNENLGEPGSIGYETDYFGEKTKQALIKFQKDKGISPAEGSFGPKTRKVMGI